MSLFTTEGRRVMPVEIAWTDFDSADHPNQVLPDGDMVIEQHWCYYYADVQPTTPSPIMIQILLSYSGDSPDFFKAVELRRQGGQNA